MRSGDKRMLEEINRIVCDQCSDFLFVYHENYKNKCKAENIRENVFVVGNTIVEVLQNIFPKLPPKNQDIILLDIHRPENFKYPSRLKNILNYTEMLSRIYNRPIEMLNFHRTAKSISSNNIDLSSVKALKVINLMGYRDFIKKQRSAMVIVSDSGTAQEEPALLDVPVIVPRDYTERPESMEYNCSFLLDVERNSNWMDSFAWLRDIIDGRKKMNSSWLGEGKTSDYIVRILEEKL
jgi:UDP-N-acetylglucosamine 2-epimerase (non-hydrolysing)